MRLTWKKLQLIWKIYPFFPMLMVLLTWRPRYFPLIEWSRTSWTHNVFRLYESVFWRRYGIRKEMTALARLTDGQTVVNYSCYTFEAFCGLLEQYVRNFIKWRIVRLPKLSFNTGLDYSPFLFAVAFDTSGRSETDASGTLTFSFTCTGTDRALIADAGNGNTATFTDVTYNSVSMTTVSSEISSASAGSKMRLMYLSAPSTGSNNLVSTWDITNGGVVTEASSFTGVKQSGQPSANSTQTYTQNASPLTQSVTTVEDNSWVVWAFFVGGVATAGTNTVIRQQDPTYHGNGIADTNSDQGTAGSKSLSVTYSSTPWNAGIMGAISPAGGGANITLLLSDG